VFATTKLWSVDKLRENIDKKNIFIEKVQNDFRQKKAIVREKINSELSRVKPSFE